MTSRPWPRVPPFSASGGALLFHLLSKLYAAVRAPKAGMRDIIEAETAPFDKDRVHFSGPNVNLQPPQAMAVSMVIHELVTNAVKYGALSNSHGTLDVKWTTTGKRLAFEWVERGGPETTDPERNGFGYVLIEGQVEQQIDGRLEAKFDPEGLNLKMDFPL